MTFALCLPKVSLSGAGAIKSLGDQLAPFGRRPLIVTEDALVQLSYNFV